MYSIDTKQSAIQAFARMADLFNIYYKTYLCTITRRCVFPLLVLMK